MMTMHNLHSSMHGVVWNEVVMSAKCCLAAAENQIALGNVAEEMYNVAVRKRNLFWGRKGKSCLVGQTLYSAPICNKARHFFVKFSKFQESTVTVHLLTRSHTSQSSRRHQSYKRERSKILIYVKVHWIFVIFFNEKSLVPIQRLVRRKSHSISSSQEWLLCRTKSSEDAILFTTILNFWSLGLIIMRTIYPHKTHFLSPPSPMIIQQLHSVTQVAHEPCIEWKISK